MRNLAIVIAIGWFWLLFTGVGPQTTGWQALTAAVALLGGCLLFALWGALLVRTRRIGPGPGPSDPPA